MLLETFEKGEAINRLLQVASEVLFYFSGSLKMSWSDLGKFSPLGLEEVVSDPEGIVVDTFSSLLSSWYNLFKSSCCIWGGL